MSTKKNHSPAFKAQVALATLSGEKTMSELVSQFGVHVTLITRWKKQLKEFAPGIFSGKIKTQEAQRDKEIHDLYAKIGQLTVERDFLGSPDTNFWH